MADISNEPTAEMLYSSEEAFDEQELYYAKLPTEYYPEEAHAASEPSVYNIIGYEDDYEGEE